MFANMKTIQIRINSYWFSCVTSSKLVIFSQFKQQSQSNTCKIGFAYQGHVGQGIKQPGLLEGVPPHGELELDDL